MGLRARIALFASLCLGVFGLVAPAASASAQPACGDTLMHDTTLNADLDCSGYSGTALTIGTNGITLNLNGHKLIGPSGADSQSGVDTGSYTRNVAVVNGTITGFTYDLYVHYSSSSTFAHLRLIGDPADTGDYGVYDDYGAGNVIKDVRATGFYAAIYAYGGASQHFLDLRVSQPKASDYGAYLSYESGDVIRNSRFFGDGSTGDGVYDSYSGANHYINDVFNKWDVGAYLYCDGYGQVYAVDNTFDNDGTYGLESYYCYAGSSSWTPGTGSHFVGNTANGNGNTGIYDTYSINSAWKDNIASQNSSYGFYMDYPGGDVMVHNTANNNDPTSAYGFYFADNYTSGYYNAYDVSYNTANNNYYGFYGSYAVPGGHNHATGNHAGPTANCQDVVCS